MLQDGGTGTSAKRVLIQQDNLANQSESTSNYGGLSSHIGQTSYALPVKGAVKMKRLALQ